MPKVGESVNSNMSVVGEEALPNCSAPFEVDKPADECGVFGIIAFNGQPVGVIAYGAALAQKHRGASATGMAYHDPIESHTVIEKGLGGPMEAIPSLAPRDGLTPADIVKSPLAIVQNRYSTDPNDDIRGAQPFRGSNTGLIIAHNGHFQGLAPVAAKYGVDISRAPSDSGAWTTIIDEHLAKTGDIRATLKELLPQVGGAYCLTLAYGGALIGVRDPQGVHPLVMGTFPNNGGAVFASEAVAFKGLDLETIRDVAPGEAVIVDKNGIDSFRFADPAPEHCLYESVYTSHEDGVTNGSSNRRARENMGRYLADVLPVDADIVVGVPDSGIPVAKGYADASGCPESPAITKNHHQAPRTFLLRGEERDRALAMKFSIDADAVRGQRLVVVDDSSIKGNVSRQIVRQLREAGASEIHLRFAGPRYESPCPRGMDTSVIDELVAHGRTDAEIAEILGADSVAFNSFDTVEKSIDEARIDPRSASLIGKHCSMCVLGERSGETLAAVNLQAAGRNLLELTLA